MALRVLVVDDKGLARSRLRALLDSCVAQGGAPVVSEASHAVEAMSHLQHHPCDALFLDIHMPGTDGLGLARVLRELDSPPAVVFVTAHAEHTLEAFELEALDYLTKPVRQERLQQALDKIVRWQQLQGDKPAPPPADFLLIQDRGRSERVPLSEIVYLKAELKYLTVRTATKTYVYDGALADVEQAHPLRWLRIHRNALVDRARIRALAHVAAGVDGVPEAEEGGAWLLTLDGVSERLQVSRRQLPKVREALATA